MSLLSIGALTVAGYRSRTGDTVTGSADVEVGLDDAERRLAEHLRRTVDGLSGLASLERTARLRMHPNGHIYPAAYPVTFSTLEIRGRALIGATPDGGPFIEWSRTSGVPYATVTWTGGYTNDQGAAPLPLTLRDAVYDLAAVISAPVAPVFVGAGVSSVSLGDASIGYGGHVAASGVDAIVPGVSGRVSAYRNRLGDGMAG